MSISVICSCTNMDSTVNQSNTQTSNGTTVNNLMPDTRDQSITPQNSYSDLFLDSAALDAFIKGGSIAEADPKTLRQFYNGRNFQYAWFTTDGLTEQAYGLWNLID